MHVVGFVPLSHDFVIFTFSLFHLCNLLHYLQHPVYTKQQTCQYEISRRQHQMTETPDTTLTDDHSELFTIKPANQWREEAAATPAPAYLFDEFWLEGEIALLFGRSGKTTLAVQIAESIASGNAVGPLRMTAKAQKVIFLDLNLTAKQFATRYIADPERRWLRIFA